MSHIIGRPDDGLLEVMLGDGTDPEQAFIGGREQDSEEGEGFQEALAPEESAVPEG